MELKGVEGRSGRDLRLCPNKAIKHWKNVQRTKVKKNLGLYFCQLLHLVYVGDFFSRKSHMVAFLVCEKPKFLSTCPKRN